MTYRKLTGIFMVSVLLIVAALSVPAAATAQGQANANSTDLPPTALQRVTDLVTVMSTRFETTISRLQDIAGRMETRNQKLAEQGSNTSTSTIHIASARNKLDEAASLLAETDEEFQDILNSGSPREQWPAFRTHVMNIKKLIGDAHNELLRALSALREAPKDQTSAATSTASSTNDTTQ